MSKTIRKAKVGLALVNLVKVPDPHAVLEAALGKMVLFADWT